jgi:hypothetical protein
MILDPPIIITVMIIFFIKLCLTDLFKFGATFNELKVAPSLVFSLLV